MCKILMSAMYSKRHSSPEHVTPIPLNIPSILIKTLTHLINSKTTKIKTKLFVNKFKR